MRIFGYAAAATLLFAGCAASLIAVNQPPIARRGRGPSVGLSTHVPANVTATAPVVEATAPDAGVAVCLVRDDERDEDARASDHEITRQLRVRLLSDQGLSSAARNVRITTENGVVTVRGNIANVRERTQIQAHAYSLRGVSRVDNLLHVAQ